MPGVGYPECFYGTPWVACPTKRTVRFLATRHSPLLATRHWRYLCLPLLRTPCRVSPFLATHTQTPGIGVSRLPNFSLHSPHATRHVILIAPPSSLESTLAKVYQNKELYLPLESTLMKNIGGGDRKST